MPFRPRSSAASWTSWPRRRRSRDARTGCRWRPHWKGSRTECSYNGTGLMAPWSWSPPAEAKLERVPIRSRREYDAVMSRIGDFADDDAAAWAMKSPDIGAGLLKFNRAVYNKNRLP